MDLDFVPRLQGSRVILRPHRDEDSAQRAALGRRRDIVRAMGGNLSSDRSMTQSAARKQINRRFGAGPHWSVADPLDQFLGLARLAPIDVENSIGTFAIALFDPDKLDQGLGTEATMLAVDYGLTKLGLSRITLTVLADNHRAISAYKKAGFAIERRIKGTLQRDGDSHDDLVMSTGLDPRSTGPLP